jgi:hypothetical protein
MYSGYCLLMDITTKVVRSTIINLNQQQLKTVDMKNYTGTVSITEIELYNPKADNEL